MAVGLTVIIIGRYVAAAFLAIGDQRSTSIAQVRSAVEALLSAALAAECDRSFAGKDGRGIASGPTCNEDSAWTTTYADGTAAPSRGRAVCRCCRPRAQP